HPPPAHSIIAWSNALSITSPRSEEIMSNSSSFYCVFYPGASSAQELMHRSPPAVADRQRERIGGIRRLWCLRQPEDSGDHLGHLSLIGPPIAANRFLHLAGGIAFHGQSALRRSEHQDPGGVGGIHHRRYVRTFENPLDRHDIRGVIGDPLAHGAVKPLESLLQWNMGLGAHHPHRDRKHCATLAGLH